MVCWLIFPAISPKVDLSFFLTSSLFCFTVRFWWIRFPYIFLLPNLAYLPWLASNKLLQTLLKVRKFLVNLFLYKSYLKSPHLSPSSSPSLCPMSQVRERASSFRKTPLLPSCGHLRRSRHAPQSCWNWLANWLWKWVGRSLGSHQWAPWRCFLPGSIQDTDPQPQLHSFFYLIGWTPLVFCYWQLMSSSPYFSVSVPRFGVKEESKAFHKCLKLLPVESGHLLWRVSLTLPGLLLRVIKMGLLKCPDWPSFWAPGYYCGLLMLLLFFTSRVGRVFFFFLFFIFIFLFFYFLFFFKHLYWSIIAPQ